MRIGGVVIRPDDRRIGSRESALFEPAHDKLLELVLCQAVVCRNRVSDLIERFRTDAINKQARTFVHVISLFVDDRFKHLHQIGRGNDLVSEAFHQLNDPRIDHRNRRNVVLRRILHSDLLR